LDEKDFCIARQEDTLGLMKIRKNDSLEGISSAVRQARRKQEADVAHKGLSPLQNAGGEGRVELSLAKTIAEQLDPEKMASERAMKVAKLKELVTSGKYRVDTTQTANALATEISLEVLTASNIGDE